MAKKNCESDLNMLGERIVALQNAEQKIRRQGNRSASQAMGAGFRIGAEITGAVIGGGLIGWGLDHWFEHLGWDTSPWGLMICFGLGCVAGFKNAWLASQRAGAAIREDDENWRQNNPELAEQRKAMSKTGFDDDDEDE